jgi:hypothetical protein
MNYTPDLWVIIEVDSKYGKHRKVLGSWYGGYLGSDHYRVSSGITKVIDRKKHYEIENESGSVYICYKGAEGMSSLTRDVYNKYKKDLKDGKLGTIKIIKEKANGKN